MKSSQTDWIGIILLSLLALLLLYAGLLSYQSIDWDILKRLESTPLLIPTQFVPVQAPPPTTPSPSIIITPTHAPVTSPKAPQPQN